MQTIIKGITKENPVFVLMLGLCSALAVTTTFESAYIMGICVTIVLLFSETVVALIKNIVPDNVRIPVYILIIGTFVTVIEILLQKYALAMYNILNIYLPLIIVNCLVLGRCLSIASKKNVSASILDALGIGIGYSVALMIIALVRELFGNGTITIIDGISSIIGFKLILEVFDKNMMINILLTPAGAFLTVGLLIALCNYLRNRKVAK